MSTTNNQSIQQINTAALRGTREAHQPDVDNLRYISSTNRVPAVPGVSKGENTMSIQICTNNGIDLDHKPVKLADRSIGLFVTQRREGTVVYSAGHGGLLYKEHTMPYARYSLAHEAPLSGAAGLIQFESDIRDLLVRLESTGEQK